MNIGRFKLGAGCLGASKEAIELSAKYANTRTQFGQPISSFPLIGKKLAEMNIRTYVTESIVYRTSGMIDTALQNLDHNSAEAGQQSAKAIAEYALECSINKVFASEALDFVADEGVQIHGVTASFKSIKSNGFTGIRGSTGFLKERTKSTAFSFRERCSRKR